MHRNRARPDELHVRFSSSGLQLAVADINILAGNSSITTATMSLDATNIERREKESEMIQTALKLADEQKNSPALILVSSEFHEGVNGIVATRLVESFYKPVLILSEIEGKLNSKGISSNTQGKLLECYKERLGIPRNPTPGDS